MQIAKVRASTVPLHAKQAQRGGRCTAAHMLAPGARKCWVVGPTIRVRVPVPNVQKAGWSSGPVWMGPENLVLTRGSNPQPSSPEQVAIPTAKLTQVYAVNKRRNQKHVQI
jgi:hypothetical protein